MTKDEKIEINSIEVTKLVAIKDIYPNPFRKEIKGGVIEEDKIEKIMANMGEDKLGVVNSLPVVIRKGRYHLVFGHARLESAKRKFGKDHKLSVTIKNYDDDNLLRGMVIENLTQKLDFQDEKDNIVLVHDYLKKNKKDNSVKGIIEWLNNVVSPSKVAELINIHTNLDTSLQDITIKTHDKPWRNEDGTLNRSLGEEERTILNTSQAAMLATFDDKQEQKDLAKALLSSREYHVRNQSNLIARYKQLKQEATGNSAAKKTIQEIRSGKKDIADVRLPQVDIDNIQKKSVKEMFIDMRRSFKAVGDFMDEVQSDNHDKKFLQKASFDELKETYTYLIDWTKEKYAPFVQEIILEARRRHMEAKEKEVFVNFNFDTNNERRSNNKNKNGKK
jgi:hypothetical protein